MKVLRFLVLIFVLSYGLQASNNSSLNNEEENKFCSILLQLKNQILTTVEKADKSYGSGPCMKNSDYLFSLSGRAALLQSAATIKNTYDDMRYHFKKSMSHSQYHVIDIGALFNFYRLQLIGLATAKTFYDAAGLKVTDNFDDFFELKAQEFKNIRKDLNYDAHAKSSC